MGDDWFYRMWSVFFCLLILYIWNTDRLNFEKFVLLDFSIYNIVDEFMYDGSIVKPEHAIVIILIPFIWFLKNKFICSNTGEN